MGIRFHVQLFNSQLSRLLPVSFASSLGTSKFIEEKTIQMNPKSFTKLVVIVATLCIFSPVVLAQGGEISLTVDATKTPEKVIRTTEVIPVKPGPLTLYYPKWIPGEHEPSGPIENVTGLKFSANGKTIPWTRDLSDVFTFHVAVPEGADRLEVHFDYLEPSGGGFATASASSTDKLIVIEWNQNLLYPAGSAASQITFHPKLILPEGWKFGTPQHVDTQSGQEITFASLSLERLVDSPVIAGEYYRAIDLTPPGEPIHHEIDLVADSEEALNMPPDIQKEMTNLVAEAGKLFGPRHYRVYHFLLTLSDHVAHFGLEHHESNDSRLPERILLEPNPGLSLGGLLAHEYAHSWSGKFRRPADLYTPNYQVPMKTDMLWDYEGFTEFAGPLLAARSGLWTPEEYRANLASISASLGVGRPGRTWRPLLDTAVAVAGGGGFARGWLNWRRGTDYYDEGDLLWLEAATIIHDQTHGQKTIDDFCHEFYGLPSNGPEVKPYTFEDVVQALNTIARYDWARFLTERLTSTSPDPPLGGIENGGWKFEFSDEMPKARARHEAGEDMYTIGLQVGGDGTVSDSLYGGPAFNAGISPGMKVVGVNGRLYTHDLLEDAIKASKDNSQGITLLLVSDDYYKTCTVDYHGGEKFPSLVRDESKPDYLDELAAAHVKSE
jgi:predicted metalloprotease with PDZ domain